MKRLTRPEANIRMELEYIECDCGFHLGVDATFVDQVGDFVIKCPSCGLDIDTAVVLGENDNGS